MLKNMKPSFSKAYSLPILSKLFVLLCICSISLGLKAQDIAQESEEVPKKAVKIFDLKMDDEESESDENEPTEAVQENDNRTTAEKLEDLKGEVLAVNRDLFILEEDLLFHLAIAKASKNSTMVSLMLLLTPPILATYERETVCEGDAVLSEVKKHEDVYLAIESKDAELAIKMMKVHFFKLSKHIEGRDINETIKK